MADVCSTYREDVSPEAEALPEVRSEVRVAELFAGVGGFRLGLDGYCGADHPGVDDSRFDMPPAGPYRTIWADQWEPGKEKRQFAARCYERRFGEGSLVNEDIHAVLDAYEAGETGIPEVDMVVGGFPCQDYSVARLLSQAEGIEGKKGVLWWEIYRFLRLKSPRFGLFENVDRLLKSPASQRGRDFAIMLSCLASLGYAAEWRVVNSAEYGFPQRRKRVFILAAKTCEPWDLRGRVNSGILARALPIEPVDTFDEFEVDPDPVANSDSFGLGGKVSPFKAAGAMQGCRVVTADPVASYPGPFATLGDVLVPESEVPEQFYLRDDQLDSWSYLKGAKREKRVARNGYEYYYSEGAIAYPDWLDRPSRTILTGEGGKAPSRFKHVVETPDGRLRRLVPEELERLQGFPAGWTDTGMTDGQRAFCMGNALVVGIPHRIGEALVQEL